MFLVVCNIQLKKNRYMAKNNIRSHNLIICGHVLLISLLVLIKLWAH